jgi:hypothetical protein
VTRASARISINGSLAAACCMRSATATVEIERSGTLYPTTSSELVIRQAQSARAVESRRV